MHSIWLEDKGWGKEVELQKVLNMKLRNEADRLVRQYTSGEVSGGTTGFLTKMGYLTHRLMEENSKLRNSSNINL